VEKILGDLIAFPTESPEGNEVACARYVRDQIEDMKLDDCKIELDQFSPTNANLIAHIGKSDEPSLIMSGHLDVVPAGEKSLWRDDPFRSHIKEGRLYGRGASDMKSGLAAMIKALEAIKGKALKKSLLFVATAGEESGFTGLHSLIERKKITSGRNTRVVIGEPTDMQVGRAHRGLTRFKLTFEGKSAHASRPDLGVNSIEACSRFLEELGTLRSKLFGSVDEELGSATITPTMLRAGTGENVIPDKAELILDSRTIPAYSFSEMKNCIEMAAARSSKTIPNSKVTTEVLFSHDSLNTPEHHELVKAAEELLGSKSIVCPFGTEGSLYQGLLGMPTIIVGPGTVEECHVLNESVDLLRLKEAVNFYQKLVDHFCL